MLKIHMELRTISCRWNSTGMNLGPLYTRGQRPWWANFQPMEGLAIKKTKECHFTFKFFSPIDSKKRRWCGEHFLSSVVIKVYNFCVPWKSRIYLDQISHNQSISIMSCPIFFNILKKYKSPFCGPFSVHTTSKCHQGQKLVSQRWAMALERFFPQLLILSVKRALVGWLQGLYLQCNSFTWILKKFEER